MKIKALAAAAIFSVITTTLPASVSANEEIRKIDTFHLGMTVEEFKAEVEKKFSRKPKYFVDGKFVDQNGEQEIVALRADGGRSFYAKGVFESSLSNSGAYGISLRQPISGKYAENHELVWNSVIEKYGEPVSYDTKKIADRNFKISANWLFDNKADVDIKSCDAAFNKRAGFRVNPDCGTYVYVKFETVSNGASLFIFLVDHVAGAADFALRNPDQAEVEAPKF
ncbi:hypothetical protein [Roseibium algae]|uniref:Lipoprotein n=1 Tax=Roseibium algae TaxID=3123038 RepID=A0ABU8TSV5_9HYPH